MVGKLYQRGEKLLGSVTVDFFNFFFVTSSGSIIFVFSTGATPDLLSEQGQDMKVHMTAITSRSHLFIKALI